MGTWHIQFSTSMISSNIISLLFYPFSLEFQLKECKIFHTVSEVSKLNSYSPYVFISFCAILCNLFIYVLFIYLFILLLIKIAWSWNNNVFSLSFCTLAIWSGLSGLVLLIWGGLSWLWLGLFMCLQSIEGSISASHFMIAIAKS